MEPTQQQLEQVLPSMAANGDHWKPTRNGEEARKKGAEIMELISRRSRYILPPSEHELMSNIGGKDRLLLWFGLFYKRMMEDPRMAVLFDARHEETNVSAAQHGRRLALAFWSRWTGDDSYYDEVGADADVFQRLQEGHQRAKKCPMRSKKLRGGSFTTAQRDSWLGHLWYAGEECGIQVPVRDGIVQHIATVIDLYGPFVQDDQYA